MSHHMSHQLSSLVYDVYRAGPTQWETAWHGCKIEALFAIMTGGRLNASEDEAQGHRFFHDAPGIYVHKDKTRKKTEGYSRYIPLFNDGVFWCSVWELQVDRTRKVPKSGTDQWVQQSGSVILKALWLRGVLYEDMDQGAEFCDAWNPLLEAHPKF